jgi:hypothetical protein
MRKKGLSLGGARSIKWIYCRFQEGIKNLEFFLLQVQDKEVTEILAENDGELESSYRNSCLDLAYNFTTA